MKDTILKKDKRTVNPASLLIARLYTVRENIGYIKRSDLTYLINKNSKQLKSNPFEKSQSIIIQNISPVRKYVNIAPVKEFLTGTTFDSGLPGYTLDPNLFYAAKSSKRELDTFVYIGYELHPNIEYLWDYIEKHKDIEAYKKELEDLKEHSKFMHHVRKEIELDELFSMRL